MYKLLCIGLTFLFLISCNQDDDPGQIMKPEQEDPNFFALQIGNEWDYEYFRYDSTTDTYTNTGVLEKVRVTDTEIINGETYFNFEVMTTGNENCGVCYDNGIANLKVRDSLGYLIKEDGEILFSSEDVEDYLISEYPFGNIFQVLEPGTFEIEVAAGNFNSLYNKKYVVDPDDGTIFEGNCDIYYSNRIGLILQTYESLLEGRLFFEKRLLSYRMDE